MYARYLDTFTRVSQEATQGKFQKWYSDSDSSSFFFNPFQNGSECESAGRSLSSIGSF